MICTFCRSDLLSLSDWRCFLLCRSGCVDVSVDGPVLLSSDIVVVLWSLVVVVNVRVDWVCWDDVVGEVGGV